MKKPAGNNARLAAVSIVQAVLGGRQNLGDAEAGISLKDARDQSFARHLSYGVLRWRTALDWISSQLLKKPLKRRDQDVQYLILLGLFQLWKDGSAPHAAINETAECARGLGKPWAVGLINAVLRRFQREQELWGGKLETRDERFSHPGWLLDLLRKDWPDHWNSIVAANNLPAPLWLRVNQNVPTSPMDRVVDGLEQSGFTLGTHPIAPEALKVSPAAPVQQLAGFDQGLFSVQDPAAQLAAGLLNVQEGHRVLDACAAPGGKTCHILEKSPGVALTVLDRSEGRLDLVRDNLERLGFAQSDRLSLVNSDATDTDSWWDGDHFDRILLDAPCSATGVIRRHPEIKWLRTPQQVLEAVNLQSVLLDRLWPLVGPGGMLLYATCSILNDENSRQIRRFLERTPNAELAGMDVNWGQEGEYGRQILPGELEMDGFFYASLCKNS